MTTAESGSGLGTLGSEQAISFVAVS